MPTGNRRVPIPGSTFAPLPGAQRGEAIAGDERIQVTVVLRPRARPAPLAHDLDAGMLLPGERPRHIGREAFAARHGAHPADVARVRRFAEENGLEVIGVREAHRTVILAGTCSALARAFDVEIAGYAHRRGAHRGFTGPVHVPDHLDGVIVAVLGLSNRPIFDAAGPRPDHLEGRAPYTAADIAKLYRFPPGDGSGERIGVIALRGGYHPSDLATFFASLGVPAPEVVDVAVHDDLLGAASGKNAPVDIAALQALAAIFEGRQDGFPTDDALATFETTMDVELCGSLAPGARIVVYFAPTPDEQGFYNALATAIHDPVQRPSVLSLSWTWNELLEIVAPGRTSPIIGVVDDLLESAAHLGVTLCVASGDDGSSYGSQDGKPSVAFPASSPYALSCGGTSVEAKDGAITSESVWRTVLLGRPLASGGGVSRIFGAPSWQVGLPVPPRPAGDSTSGRGVPDVGADADPFTGCRLWVGGQEARSAGTSAAAPLWAGLVARLNHALGTPLGFATPLLYHLASQYPDIFRPTTEGTNGDYPAGSPWNACTGLGSPVGERLLAVLRSAGGQTAPGSLPR
jgi:kumamolisin